MRRKSIRAATCLRWRRYPGVGSIDLADVVAAVRPHCAGGHLLLTAFEGVLNPDHAWPDPLLRKAQVGSREEVECDWNLLEEIGRHGVTNEILFRWQGAGRETSGRAPNVSLELIDGNTWEAMTNMPSLGGSLIETLHAESC